jgi:hypothetical protein
MFSRSPDGSTWLKPDSVSQRYERMCARLGWDMNIHQLRHYSATELISAGVDVRTVAGRLGHGGGGVTTLRVYSAWVPEADKRAAGTLAERLPAPPSAAGSAQTAAVPFPEVDYASASPYMRIATDLRGAITSGVLGPGDSLPTLEDLATRYEVSVGTAHRAVALLAAEGRVIACSGRRTVVAPDPVDRPA